MKLQLEVIQENEVMFGLKRGIVKLISYQEEWDRNAENTIVLLKETSLFRIKIEIQEDEFMNIIDKNIDGGKAFDWGKTSAEYAKFRDIYPKEFYNKIVNRGLCINGQKVLDVGTGTGVLPRNMYHYGAIAELKVL